MSFKHIEINIGKACNNKCRFCMSAKVGANEKELTDFELVKKEIIRYSEKGYKSIGFLGGDISIHPRIYEIISEARNNGFININVITNGMIFSDYNKALKLVDSGCTRINLSIHSHVSNIEDYITQIPGGLEKKLAAIDNFNIFKDKGLLKNDLSINLVLNGLNYKDILKTCLYFHKVKKIDDIRINFLWNRFFTTEQDRLKMELSYCDFKKYLKELIILSLHNSIRITFDSIPYCIFYDLGLSNPKFIVDKFIGESFDYIEEVSNINMKEIFNWKEQKQNDLKVKFEKCSKCIYSNVCQGVWKEYVEKYGEGEFNPII